MKQITIEISPDGGVEIKASGFKGNSCEAATKALEEALGAKTKSTKTPEYYAQIVGHQSNGGGK